MSALAVDENSFEKEVLNADVPVLVDFWATWCGPCKMVGPIVAEIAEEYEGKVKVGKVNVDEQRALAAKFGIMSIPTLILFKGGKPVAQRIGLQDADSLEQLIKES